MRVRLYFESEQTILAFPDYPSYCLGDALNGISIDGRCYIVPNDRVPQQDWCWRFESKYGEAAVKITKHFEHEVNDDQG